MRRQGESDERADSSAASPVRVFLALMAVLVVVGAVVLITRDDDPPEPTPTESPSPNFALTDAEAIARFKELRDLHLSAYRDRDISLLPLVFTRDSNIGQTVRKEIQSLLRDGVVPKPRYETQMLSVRVNTASEIRLVESVRFRARFFDEKGNDVTVGRKEEMQIIEWVLRPQESVWLIHASKITKSMPVRR